MESIIQAKRQIVKVNGVAAFKMAATGYPGYDRRMPFKIVTDVHLSHITRRLMKFKKLIGELSLCRLGINPKARQIKYAKAHSVFLRFSLL